FVFEDQLQTWCWSKVKAEDDRERVVRARKIKALQNLYFPGIQYTFYGVKIQIGERHFKQRLFAPSPLQGRHRIPTERQHLCLSRESLTHQFSPAPAVKSQSERYRVQEESAHPLAVYFFRAAV